MHFALLFFLLFAPATRADISLGTIAGGQLKVVEAGSEDESDQGGSFSVEWRKGKQKRTKSLFEYSAPPNMGMDNYHLHSATLNGENIKVVIERLGAYDYRGDSRTTYLLSFNPKSFTFSKVKSNTVSQRDLVVQKLRTHFRKCDPAAPPTQDFIEESITENVRDANAILVEDVYLLLFEEMHGCALTEFKKGNKAAARALALKAMAPIEPKKDWICLAIEEEGNGNACKTRKEVFLESFVPSRTPLANDMGFFLTEDSATRPLAKEILAAVVKRAPERAVAQLNYADLLWEMGEQAPAKEHYREYLKLAVGKNAATAKEREKAQSRAGK